MTISPIRQEIEKKLCELEDGKPEAKTAAIDILNLLKEHRVVCACAETQMGKTTICRLIAKHTIKNLSNKDLDKLDHKVVVYIENVANNDLAAQADDNFAHLSENVAVESVTRASALLDTLPDTHGILFIIDESHMGCDHLAKRLNEILAKIEDRDVKEDRILLVSATGFSSIYEASKEKSIMGYSAAIRVVQPPEAYRGISQFLEDNQIIDNSDESCFYQAEHRTPSVFKKFVDTLLTHSGGLYIIRSSAGNTQLTKDKLLELTDQNGQKILAEENVKIVASSLNDVEKDDLDSWNGVLRSYQAYKKRNKKLVIIVRGFLRVGIAMPPEMKEDLIATWDGTSSAVSSVVQALIGRACGYHNNTKALHFSHKNMLKAHSELNERLSELAKPPQIQLNDIALAIQTITHKYSIPNWDPGLTGTDRTKAANRLKNKIAEPQYSVSGWASYSFDPNKKLKADEPDLQRICDDLGLTHDDNINDVIEIISAIHAQYRADKKGEIPVKSGRRFTGIKYISGQFINKKTFINAKHGQRRKIETALTEIHNQQDVSFNNLRTQGAGKKKIDQVDYVAYVISTYNVARDKGQQSDSQLTLELMKPFCEAYGIEPNNTVVILFKKGDVNVTYTQKIQQELNLKNQEIIEDGHVVRKGVYAMEKPTVN
ncbi:hypothetical protein [Vibrio harveyi]|uniref:hypothetical protein n=1 Tax=Vibrio harveyi TaxID=669 RepID=UPI003CF2AD7D